MKMLDEPCQTEFPSGKKCGWKYAGFHFCINPDTQTPLGPTFKKKHPGPSDEARAAAGRSRAERWQEYREEMAERDAAIVRLYKEGNGYNEIANELGISHSTVAKIVREAAAADELTVRPRGSNLRWQRQKAGV